jgi:chromate transporter
MSIFFLYLLFVKYGLLAFGGGYVLITLFIHDLVEKYQLITAGEFANLLAIAQMTHGPIGINTATYVGFKTFGIAGGIIATLGLITPAIFLVITAAFYFKKWENSRIVQGLLYGMRPATIGLILSAILVFANIAVFSTPLTVANVKAWIAHDPAVGSFGIRVIPLLIVVASATAMARFKVNILYIIVFSAIIGALFIR